MRTFRELSAEAQRRLGFTEEQIKDAADYADRQVGFQAIVDKPVELKPGMTEEEFINELMHIQGLFDGLSQNQLDSLSDSLDKEVNRRARRN